MPTIPWIHAFFPKIPQPYPVINKLQRHPQPKTTTIHQKQSITPKAPMMVLITRNVTTLRKLPTLTYPKNLPQVGQNLTPQNPLPQ